MTGALLLVFPALMSFAAISDFLSMTISNKVSLLLVVGFGVLAVAAGMSLSTVGIHVVVGTTALLLTFGCFAMGWMGGGDAKLMAASALWFGPTSDLLYYIILSSILGGVLTLGLLVLRARLAPVTGVGFVDRLLHQETGIPYGIALGIAGLVVFADSAWMDVASAG